MSFKTPVTIAETLQAMHRHDYVLPAIQREFVWREDKVVRLFDSLMRGYPIGSFLFWKIDPEPSWPTAAKPPHSPTGTASPRAEVNSSSPTAPADTPR